MTINSVMEAAEAVRATGATHWQGFQVKEGKLQAHKGFLTGVFSNSTLETAQKSYDAALEKEAGEYSWYNPIGWILSAFNLVKDAANNMLTTILNCFGYGEAGE